MSVGADFYDFAFDKSVRRIVLKTWIATYGH